MTHIPLVIAVLLSLSTLACQMTTTNESRSTNLDSTSTGLSGYTLIAAPCPGPLTDEPCPDQPLRASFEVLDAQNKVVARFESDDEGRFQLALPPGSYTIVPEASAPLFNARNQYRPVTVQGQTITEVTLRFDSGMR